MPLIKNDNKQKKHKGENIIGKIIYGFLLFAPLLSILITCLYVAINKNSYLAYQKEYTQEVFRVTDNNTIQNGQSYYMDNVNTPTGNADNNQFTINFTSISIDLNETALPEHDYVGLTVRTYANGQGGYYVGKYLLNGTLTSTSIVYQLFPYKDFSFVADTQYGNLSISANTYLYQVITKQIDTTPNALNVFENAIQKVEESNLYNWSKTTGTYTVLNNTCNLLGITNTFTPMLLAYWLIISVIYFIYDIALILVWMVHKKIHELTDAI